MCSSLEAPTDKLRRHTHTAAPERTGREERRSGTCLVGHRSGVGPGHESPEDRFAANGSYVVGVADDDELQPGSIDPEVRGYRGWWA